MASSSSSAITSSSPSAMTSLKEAKDVVDKLEAEVKGLQAEVKELQAKVDKLASDPSTSDRVFKVAEEAWRDAKKREDRLAEVWMDARKRLAKAEDHQRALELRAMPAASSSSSASGPNEEKDNDDIQGTLLSLPLTELCSRNLPRATIEAWVKQHGEEMSKVPVSAKGKFLTVTGLKRAGLDDKFPLLFRRNDCVELHTRIVQEVDSRRQRELGTVPGRIFVAGPPGTGKSTTTWQWLLQDCARNPAQLALWVHRTRWSRFIAVVFVNGCWASFELGDATKVIEWDHWDLVVLDGMRKIDSDHELIRRAPHVPVVVVSSVELGVAYDEDHCATLEVMSWNLEEYIEACTDPQFWAQAQRGVLPRETDRANIDALGDVFTFRVPDSVPSATSSSSTPALTAEVDTDMTPASPPISAHQPDDELKMNNDALGGVSICRDPAPSSASSAAALKAEMDADMTPADPPMSAQPGDELKMNDQEITRLLQAKFFLVGGCARWMFGMNWGRVAVDIQKALASQGDKSFYDDSIGARSDTQRSHLLRWVRSKNGATKYVPVSQYVLNRLSAVSAVGVDRFILQGMRIAKDLVNNSFLGWLYELKFREDVARGKSIHVTVTKFENEELDPPQREEWTAPSCFEYKGVPLHEAVLQDGAWGMPTKPNQGCFDFTQICKPSKRFESHIVLRVQPGRATKAARTAASGSSRHASTSSCTTRKRKEPSVPAAGSSSHPKPCRVRLAQATAGQVHDLKWAHTLQALRDIHAVRPVQQVHIDVVVPDQSYFRRYSNVDRESVHALLGFLPVVRVVVWPLPTGSHRSTTELTPVGQT